MKERKYIIILFLLIIFHLINIFFWFNLGTWPIGKDWYWHMNNTFKMINNIDHQFSFQNLVFVDIAYAPLYYWTGIIIVKLFSCNNVLFFNSAMFFVILSFAVYAIGKKVADRKTGILSVVICSFFPAIYEKSIQYNLTLATIALVALCAYFLLRSNNFQDCKNSIFSGICFGSSLLIRQSAILFLVGPILITMLDFGNHTYESKKNKILNVLIFLFISTIIASVFYSRIEIIQNILERTGHIAKVSDKNIFTWSHMTFYIKALPKQISLINTVLFLAGVCSYAKLNASHRYFLLSWIVFPLIVLSFIKVKEFEFSMPYLPVIALNIAILYKEISKKIVGRILVLILIVISMCQYFANFGRIQ